MKLTLETLRNIIIEEIGSVRSTNLDGRVTTFVAVNVTNLDYSEAQEKIDKVVNETQAEKVQIVGIPESDKDLYEEMAEDEGAMLQGPDSEGFYLLQLDIGKK